MHARRPVPRSSRSEGVPRADHSAPSGTSAGVRSSRHLLPVATPLLGQERHSYRTSDTSVQAGCAYRLPRIGGTGRTTDSRRKRFSDFSQGKAACPLLTSGLQNTAESMDWGYSAVRAGRFPKLDVAGSNPVDRSRKLRVYGWRPVTPFEFSDILDPKTGGSWATRRPVRPRARWWSSLGPASPRRAPRRALMSVFVVIDASVGE